uniref:Uncharacterized protein n=1 Tax=Anguilla anguilla TaxID=7936 RepID=A0A0E9T1X8_ANGAN
MTSSSLRFYYCLQRGGNHTTPIKKTAPIWHLQNNVQCCTGRKAET